MNYSIVNLPLDLIISLRSIKNFYVNIDLACDKNYGVSKNFEYSKFDILKESKTVLSDHNQMPFLEKNGDVYKVWNYIQSLITQRALLHCYIIYSVNSYQISSETDFQSNTILVCLNDLWQDDWAGNVTFNCIDKTQGNSINPKIGQAIISTDSVTINKIKDSNASFPRAFLVFKTVHLDFLSPEIKFLIDKTINLVHSGKTFFEHLYNVMTILENRNERKEVILAGLYHSIYGTEYFNFYNENVNRQIVKELIGDYAENLVFEFCTIKDRLNTLLQNTKGYDVQFRKDLLTIELANLIDQNINGFLNKKIRLIIDSLKNC